MTNIKLTLISTFGILLIAGVLMFGGNVSAKEIDNENKKKLNTASTTQAVATTTLAVATSTAFVATSTKPVATSTKPTPTTSATSTPVMIMSSNAGNTTLGSGFFASNYYGGVGFSEGVTRSLQLAGIIFALLGIAMLASGKFFTTKTLTTRFE